MAGEGSRRGEVLWDSSNDIAIRQAENENRIGRQTSLSRRKEEEEEEGGGGDTDRRNPLAASDKGRSLREKIGCDSSDQRSVRS